MTILFQIRHDLETKETAEEKIQGGGGINKRTGEKTMSTTKTRTKSSLLPYPRGRIKRKEKKGKGTEEEKSPAAKSVQLPIIILSFSRFTSSLVINSLHNRLIRIFTSPR